MAQKRPISAAEGWAREVGASVEATQDGSQARTPGAPSTPKSVQECGPQDTVRDTKGQEEGRAGEKRNREVKE